MMKKILSVIIALILSLGIVPVLADGDITVVLDGKQLESPVSPMIVNDSTMVPFRVIFEALKMDVNWSEALQKVYAMNDEKTIILTIGSDKMLVNTDLKELPAAPFISNSSTLVPVRAVSEAVGADVKWDSEERLVIIKTKEYIANNPDEQEQPKEDKPEEDNKNEGKDENEYTPIIDENPAYINKNGDAMSTELIKILNQYRVDEGLAALETDPNVSLIALSHSMDMAEYDYIDHVSIFGVGPFERLDGAGIYYLSAAENIASGFRTPSDVAKSWMASPAHRQNILNPEFTHIGVGYHSGGSNGTYWTLLLLER